MENVQNKGPFPCSPQKDFLPPFEVLPFFKFHLVHLMNMYNHRSKHVFIVKKIEAHILEKLIYFLLSPLKEKTAS